VVFLFLLLLPNLFYLFLLQIYTIEDRAEVHVYVPSAKELCRFYDKAWCSYVELKDKIEASWSKVFFSCVRVSNYVVEVALTKKFLALRFVE